MRYLAIDIGASGGKILSGMLHDGKLKTKEEYRFPNGPELVDGHLVWNIPKLFHHIIEGLRKAGSADYVSIDTWGVDYVLLDKDANVLGPTFCYRDKRCEDISIPISKKELYARTGTQYQRFNTIYQLVAHQREYKDLVDRAEDLLFIPDYLNFLLTGRKSQEYTFASTTGLLDAREKRWDYDLIDSLSLPAKLFNDISYPGLNLDKMKKEISAYIGYSPEVLLSPSHDTASAVIGSPMGKGELFLSSGTWSLLGTVIDSPILTEESRKANFTNEGGAFGDIRYLKNIIGTWLLQNLRKECDDVDFMTLEREAEEACVNGYVDAFSERFLAPESMKGEISKALAEGGFPQCSTRGEIARVIYESLSNAYKQTIDEISALTGKKYKEISIVGGGSKDRFLARLCASKTGMAIKRGPIEATGVGNLISSMIATGEIEKENRIDIIKRSFDIKEERV